MLVVRSTRRERIVAHLEPSTWMQYEGRDVLTPTDEIAAAPLIFTLAPGEAQIVQVDLRREPEPNRELAYRLFLREVPKVERPPRGLSMAFATSVPVFVVSSRAVRPQLAWRALRMPDGKIRLRAENSGGAHIELGRVELTVVSSGSVLTAREAKVYLLPGLSRSWILESETAVELGARLRIATRTGGGRELRTQVRLEDGDAHADDGARVRAGIGRAETVV